MEIKHYMKLIPLTIVPDTCNTIIDWIPFDGGDTIDAIVNEYNCRCINYYKSIDWLPEDIEKEAVGLNVVQNDLRSICMLDQSVYQKVKIMILDLRYLSEVREVLDTIKLRLARTGKSLFVPQICSGEGIPITESHLTLFRNVMVHPSEPNIIPNQDMFEKWLDRFFQNYGEAIVTTKAVFESEQIGTVKASKLTEIAEEIRDVSLIKKIKTQDIATLARFAVAQELALGEIVNKFGAHSKPPIILTQVKQDLLDVDLKENGIGLKETELLHVTLKVPTSQLSKVQRVAAIALGIRNEGVASIIRDSPTSIDLIGKLGSTVQSAKFVADLATTLKRGG